MLATIVFQIPVVMASMLQPALPPDCQLDVLPPLALEQRSLTEFNANIDAYLTLQRRLARALPPLEMFDDEDPFFADELRQALVAARPDARPGAFFTPMVAEVLRQRIDFALAYHGAGAVPFRPHAPAMGFAAKVNEPLPPIFDLFAWAPVLAELPPLPEELAFVVAGRDLVLVDVATDLVLDVLSNAVPPMSGDPFYL